MSEKTTETAPLETETPEPGDESFEKAIEKKFDHYGDILLGRAGLALDRMQRNSRLSYAMTEAAATGKNDPIIKALSKADEMGVSIGNTVHYHNQEVTANTPKEEPKPVIDIPDLPPLPGASLVKPVLIGLAALAAIAGTGWLTAFLVGGKAVDLTEINVKLEALMNRETTVIHQGKEDDFSLGIGPLLIEAE